MRAYNLAEKRVNVVIVLVVRFQILVGKQDNPSHILVLAPPCNLVDTRCRVVVQRAVMVVAVVCNWVLVHF